MKSLICSSCGKGRLRLKFPPEVYECDACKIGTVGPARLRCAVPFCDHTRGQRKGEGPIREGEEWVCGEHWRAVPKSLRRVYSRMWRRIKVARARDPLVIDPPTMPKGEARYRAFAMWRCKDRIWKRCMRAAIERGVGI